MGVLPFGDLPMLTGCTHSLDGIRPVGNDLDIAEDITQLRD